MSINPLLTNYGPNTPLYAPASGGGGGGGGPNINVSSINFTSNPGYITYTGGIAIDGLNTGAQDFLFASPINYQPAFPAGLNSTLGCAFTMTAPDNEAYIQTTVAMNEAIFIDAVGAGGAAAIYVNAGGVATANIGCSTLTVSSINGQPFSGGGGGSLPANPSFSTVTLADEPTALGGKLIQQATDVNLYSLAVADSNALLVAEMQLGTIGGRNQVYMNVCEVPAFYTSTITGTTGVIQLNPSGTEQIRIGGLGAPGDITINTVGGGLIQLNGPVVATTSVQATAATVTVSTLVVSSINGAAPGGGSSITRTTVPTVASGSILGDGSLFQVTNNFTTTAGHLYSLSGFIYASASSNISSNASLALQIGNVDRAYQSAMPLWGYSAAGGLSFGNNIPVSFMWRANSGSTVNNVYAQMVDALGTAVSTVINSSNGLMLVDYGPVA